MSERPWHKRFHGDAIAGYIGLSLEERGAYSTILDLLYDRREPLMPNMRLLAGYLDVSVRKAEGVLNSLILKGKLYRLDDARISNRRFEKELENDLRTSNLKANIGKIGGRKSAEQRKSVNENSGGATASEQQRSSLTRDQKPETRIHKERKKGSTAVVDAIASPGSTPSQPVAVVVETEMTQAIKIYNEGAALCPGGMGAGWAVCTRSLTANRGKAMRARLKEVGLDGWRAAVTRATRSDFLSGRAKRGPGHENWGVDIGWLAKAENFAKLSEGKYDNGRGRAQPRGQDSARAGLMDFLRDGPDEEIVR